MGNNRKSCRAWNGGAGRRSYSMLMLRFHVLLLISAPCDALRNVDRCELLIWTHGALAAGDPVRLVAEATSQDTLVALLHEGKETRADEFMSLALRRFPLDGPV